MKFSDGDENKIIIYILKQFVVLHTIFIRESKNTFVMSRYINIKMRHICLQNWINLANLTYYFL